MLFLNLQEPNKSSILPFIIKFIIKLYQRYMSICSKFWTQLSGVAAYAVITRIGKRYCPYLVRWHWTFYLLLEWLNKFLFILYIEFIIFKHLF
jgi:hypothetical protein